MHPIEKLFLGLSAVVVMAGMGATLTAAIIKETMKRPQTIMIGMVCQFGLMPLIAYSLATAFSVPDTTAIGIILVGCSPGGLLSNIFTYFSRGNVSLSITMTAMSCVVASFMMPLLIYVYAEPFTSEELQAPYGELFVGLVALLVPAAFGMGVRSRNLRWATRIERAGSLTGFLVLVYLLATWFPKYGYILTSTGLGEIAACGLLSITGFTLAFLFSSFFKMSARDRGTVVIETGVQNANLALIIITLAFVEPVLGRIQWALFLYGLFALIFGIAATALFRRLNERAAREVAAFE